MYEYSKEILKLVPPGFCLDNYAGSEECNTEKWEYNIHARVIVQLTFYCIKKGQEGMDETLRDDINENIKKGFYDQVRRKEEKEKNGTVSYSPIIRQANIDHLNILISDYERYKSENKAIDPKIPLDEFSMFSSHGSPLSIAAINIQAPDDVLIKEFKTWLKDVRKSREIPAKKRVISPSTLRRWHEAKVLPYIDLIHWNQLNKISTTDGQIGQILFPKDASGGVAERVRKTTKKHAQEILARNTGYSLSTQNYSNR